MSASQSAPSSWLGEYCRGHFKALAAGILALSFAVHLTLLLLISTLRPEIFSRTIIGYIVQNISNPQWSVDFAYPPLTYIFYRALLLVTSNPILLRLPSVASDMLGGVFLVRIAVARLSRSRSLLALLLYTCNPLLIWLTVTGGFDSIAILMMLLAVGLLLEERPFSASLSLALGFNLKWFPILLIPVFLKYPQRLSLRRRSLLYLLPSLVIFGATLLILPLFTSATLAQMTRLSSNYYAGKGPTGFSIWYLSGLLGLYLPNNILTSLAYLSQMMALAWISLRYTAASVNSLMRFSFLLLLPVVNLSIQLYPYYFLWFSPFLLVTIMAWLPQKKLIVAIVLTALSYALPNLYVFLHFWPNFSDQPWPAPSNAPLDLALFLGAHLASWLLLAIGLKWSRD